MGRQSELAPVDAKRVEKSERKRVEQDIAAAPRALRPLIREQQQRINRHILRFTPPPTTINTGSSVRIATRAFANKYTSALLSWSLRLIVRDDRLAAVLTCDQAGPDIGSARTATMGLSAKATKAKPDR